MGSITIVCISDSHELRREIDLPNGDLLIHAGDLTMFSKSAAAILDFNDWLGELPHRFRVVTAGNHEFFLESDPSKRRLLSNATVLINESVEVMGLKIWGTPTTPLYGGAFGRTSPNDRKRLYASIPDDTDILISHGPPVGVLDCAPGSSYHAGDPELLEAVKRIKPKIHLFGHCHLGETATVQIEDTLFVNAALLGPDGDLSGKPVVLTMTHD